MLSNTDRGFENKIDQENYVFVDLFWEAISYWITFVLFLFRISNNCWVIIVMFITFCRLMVS